MNVILFILMSLYASYFWKKNNIWRLVNFSLNYILACAFQNIVVLKWGRKNRWFLEKVVLDGPNHLRRNEWFFIGHHGWFFSQQTFVLMINIIFVAPPNLKFVAFWTKGKRTQRRAQASCSNSRSFCWRLEVRCFENHRKEQPFFQPSSRHYTCGKDDVTKKRFQCQKCWWGPLHLASKNQPLNWSNNSSMTKKSLFIIQQRSCVNKADLYLGNWKWQGLCLMKG